MRSIAHISDLHFGRIDARIVEALAQDLNDRQPSVVVVSGDLTQRGRRGQYRRAVEFLKRIPQPQIVVPGNHDVPLYDVVRRFCFTTRRYEDYITPDLSPVYRDDELFILGMNTARAFSPRLTGFWKDGRIDSQHLLNLRRQTEHLPAGLFRVVVTHHPFIPPSPEFAGDVIHGASTALQELRRSKIDLLLAGHLHLSYCGDAASYHGIADGSILSVQAGSATSTRRREAKNSYNWIDVRTDRVTIDVRASDGGAFSMDRSLRFVRTQGSWKAQ